MRVRANVAEMAASALPDRPWSCQRTAGQARMAMSATQMVNPNVLAVLSASFAQAGPRHHITAAQVVTLHRR